MSEGKPGWRFSTEAARKPARQGNSTRPFRAVWRDEWLLPRKYVVLQPLGHTARKGRKGRQAPCQPVRIFVGIEDTLKSLSRALPSGTAGFRPDVNSTLIWLILCVENKLARREGEKCAMPIVLNERKELAVTRHAIAQRLGSRFGLGTRSKFLAPVLTGRGCREGLLLAMANLTRMRRFFRPTLRLPLPRRRLPIPRLPERLTGPPQLDRNFRNWPPFDKRELKNRLSSQGNPYCFADYR